MKPFAKFLSLALPSMVLGGLLFQSPVGHADDKSRGPNVVVKNKNKDKDKDKHQDDDARVFFSGNSNAIRGLVRSRLAAARHALLAANLPPQVRDKALARFDKVNALVDRRLAKIDFKNLDQLEEQMEGFGEEIEEVMEGLEEEMEALAKSGVLDAHLKQQLGGLNLNLKLGDDDDDEDEDDDSWGTPMPRPTPRPYAMPAPPTPPTPPTYAAPPAPPAPPSPPSPLSGYDSLDVSADLDFDASQLQLRPDQRAALKSLRSSSDSQIKPAKQALDALSKQLNTTLSDLNAAPQAVSQLVDQISRQEATIRKIRLNAWLKTRQILDGRQRRVLENGN